MKLFVDNLPISEEKLDFSLGELFQKYRPHSLDVAIDNFTGRPKGFAIVELSSEAADEAAVTLEGATISGRPIRIHLFEAEPESGHRHSGR